MSINTAIPEEERQPTRRGTAETTRTFDQTFLDPEDESVHRDVAGHAGRWYFAARGPHPDILDEIPYGVSYMEHFLKYGINKKPFVVHEETDVLDVGCGPKRPLLLALFGGIGPYPLARSYTGVDLNKVKQTRHARSKIYDETNFFEKWVQIKQERGPFDLITNFEVIEHMPAAQGHEMLSIFRQLLRDDDSRILLSTPVFDGMRAKNHIHEYTIEKLQSFVEAAGLKTYKRYGTFANVAALRQGMKPEHVAAMKALGEYYGNDVLSTIFAPLYPDLARNNLWVLGRA